MLTASAAEPRVLTCASCHPQQAREHAATLMADTLVPGDSPKVLQGLPGMAFELGPYRYQLQREDGANYYIVTDGRDIFRAKVLWGVGQGEAGQTYVLERDGELRESRVSYYKENKGLAVTIGAPPGEPKDLAEAAGRVMRARDVGECFTCHTAPRTSGKPVNSFGSTAWAREDRVAGVQCENCHAGALQHQEALRRGDPKAARPARLKGLAAEEMNELCGSCHRTWADIKLNGPRGIGNVKFQPYRLTRSKCFDASDPRISCTACHDAHNRPLPAPPPESYDAACKSCHTGTAEAKAKAASCKMGTEKCVTCHMPKLEMPGAHHLFADHRIRIAKAGEPYPD